jgi:hypothetical protein
MQAPTTTVTTTVPIVGYDFLTPLLRLLFGDTGLISFVSLDGAAGFLNIIWMMVVVFGYLIAFFFLYFYIYAVINVYKLLAIEDERVAAHERAFQMKQDSAVQSHRFGDVRLHIGSSNPNDWKLAIIECDIMLDQALKTLGYPGTSLGERLRSISPSQLSSLDDAWEAHKIRNQIAHGGADFVLTQKLAQETVVKYERVLAELGVL